MFDLFLVSSGFLVNSFRFGFVDSSSKGGNILFELINFGSEFGFFFGQLVTCGRPFTDPVFVVPSFDLSGLLYLANQLVAQGDHLIDGGLLGLNGGGTGYFGHQLENTVPGLSLEVELAVLAFFYYLFMINEKFGKILLWKIFWENKYVKCWETWAKDSAWEAFWTKAFIASTIIYLAFSMTDKASSCYLCSSAHS